MKKFLIIPLCAATVFSVFAIGACSDGKDSLGVVNGNYVAASDEELNDALDGIDLDNVFGDTSSEGHGFGLNASAEFYGSLFLTENMYYTEDVSANYLLSVKTNGETPDLSGKGNFSVNAVTAFSGTQQTLNYSGSVYNDSRYFYLDAVATDAIKVKASLTELYYALLSQIPAIPDISINEGGFSLDAVLNGTFADAADAYLDLSEGVKIKYSVKEDAITDVLAQIAKIDDAANAVTVSTFKLDVYMAFDPDGLFSAFAIDADIDISVDLSGVSVGNLPVSINKPVNIVLRGGVSVAASDAEVSLPADLATDAAYTDSTNAVISALFGYLPF